MKAQLVADLADDAVDGKAVLKAVERAGQFCAFADDISLDLVGRAGVAFAGIVSIVGSGLVGSSLGSTALGGAGVVMHCRSP